MTSAFRSCLNAKWLSDYRASLLGLVKKAKCDGPVTGTGGRLGEARRMYDAWIASPAARHGEASDERGFVAIHAVFPSPRFIPLPDARRFP
jgi:hypothetical protein